MMTTNKHLEVYLRVVTNLFTVHLPLVKTELEDDKVLLIFNWIVFEDDVILTSTQPFAEAVRNPDSNGTGILEPFELSEETFLHPDDEMYRIEAKEIGCFFCYIPHQFFLDIDPDWTL